MCVCGLKINTTAKHKLLEFLPCRILGRQLAQLIIIWSFNMYSNLQQMISVADPPSTGYFYYSFIYNLVIHMLIGHLLEGRHRKSPVHASFRVGWWLGSQYTITINYIHPQLSRNINLSVMKGNARHRLQYW